MDPDNPLIPPAPGELMPPPGIRGDELLNWYIEAGLDHMSIHAIVWPARDRNGDLAPPPPDHVLDHLARVHELVDEDEILSSSGAGTVAVVGELPTCDTCDVPGARYDVMPDDDSGRLASYQCPDCYSVLGSGWLGASGDVYLMRRSEVPLEVREICNQICARNGRAPLFDV